mmetsp:Transcript_10316/g.20277  ORF Transcript_10316/g.20277 Transcript_10316/m.20277 type:complete len:238 (-) Transcript_10316:375-1088(-)
MSLENPLRGTNPRPPSLRRHRLKFVLLGEGRVGKTSILLRFCTNEFDGRQPATLNASFLDKNLTIDGRPAQLCIWDTAGQERFHALGPIYYRDADAALLVYDITDADSFVKVKNWVRELRKVVGEGIAIAIAGNKADLERSRNVDPAEAERYAASVGANHFLMSAKINIGVDEAFIDMARRVLDYSQEIADGAANTSSKSLGSTETVSPNRIVLVDEDSSMDFRKGNISANSSSGCC